MRTKIRTKNKRDSSSKLRQTGTARPHRLATALFTVSQRHFLVFFSCSTSVCLFIFRSFFLSFYLILFSGSVLSRHISRCTAVFESMTVPPHASVMFTHSLRLFIQLPGLGCCLVPFLQLIHLSYWSSVFVLILVKPCRSSPRPYSIHSKYHLQQHGSTSTP